MKKLTLFTLILASFQLTAQTYYSGFDDASQNEGWEEFRTGAADPLYHWNVGGELSHGYPVGGDEFTNDWYVSPEFNFSEGGFIDSISYRFAGFGLPVSGDTIAIYVLNGSQNPTEASSITLLKHYYGDDYQNDLVWRKDTAIGIPPFTGSSYIAFRYTTDSNWLDVAFDDIYIREGNETSIFEYTQHTLMLTFPNPATSQITIDSQEEGTLKVFNILGEKVLEQEKESIKLTLDIEHLPEGLYNIYLNNSFAKFVKE